MHDRPDSTPPPPPVPPLTPGAAPIRWTVNGLRFKPCLILDSSPSLVVVVAGGLWKTRSVFQGVWEGAGGRVGAAAFHTPADRRPG